MKILPAFAALAFLIVGTMPAAAQDALTWAQLEGTWETVYLDDELGAVSGEARVADGTVRLLLFDPETRAETTLDARSARIDGNVLLLTFDRPALGPPAATGAGFPQEMIGIGAPRLDGLTLKGGTEEIEVPVARMPPTDTQTLEVRLTRVSETALAGSWRYRVHPFIGRAEDGLGRAGGLHQDEDGTWWASSGESWRRPVPQVYGAVPVQDQLSKEMFSDGTSMAWYGYPFRPGAADSGKTRTLFVFGRDLPRDWSQSIEIEATTPGITYHEIARLSDFREREDARAGYRTEVARDDREMDEFVRGRRIVRNRVDAGAVAKIDELDAVIVRATLSEEVVPGWQTFEYGGSEAAWLLQFGDNTATLRIVRKVERTGDKHEPTGVLFAGETFRIEIETRQPLPVERIPVIVASVPSGASFDDWSDGGVLIGDGEGIPAIRSAENPRIYRTEFIRNDPRVAPGTAVEAGAGGASRHLLHGSQGTRIFATIAEPGIISIPPTMAQATIFTVPRDTAVGGDWTSWLAKAAQCAGLDATDRIRTERAEAETISTYLINSGRSRFPIPGSFDSKVSVGQHAGMLLMRDTFWRQLERTRAAFASIETDEEILAFRRAMDPIVRQGNTPLTRIEVTGIDGAPTTFDWTFETAVIGDVHDRRVEDVEAWAINATREALRVYGETMSTTAREAREIDPCDVESLLKLTGYGFDAVAALAKTKLMMAAPAPLYWAPDFRARAHVDNVALVADSVRIGEQLGEADRREAALAVAIATIPVAIVGGMAGSTAAIVATFAIDVIDVGASTYAEISDKLGRDAEYDFALAAADVTGMHRLERAEERRRSWASVMGQLFPTVTLAAIGLTVDVPDIYKAFGEGLTLTRAARGRKALMEGLDIPAATADAPARARAAGEELEAALERARAAQAAGEVSSDPPSFTGSSPDLNAGPAAPARGIRFDELPDALSDSADDIFTYLDDLSASGVLSQLDDAVLESAEAAGRGADDAFPWEAGLSAEARALADRLISRGRIDVLDLMEEAGARIARLLDDADEVRALYARQVLESEPGLTAEAFERAVETLYKRRPREIGEAFFTQADPANREIGMALEDAGWRFEFDGDGTAGGYKIFDPDRRAGEIIRSFDPATGRFKMTYAKAEMSPRPTGPVIDGLYEVQPGFVRGKIDDILPVPNAGNGVPTIQFFTMRLMNRLGVKYGSAGAGAIRETVMSGIANVRTIVTLEYLRRLYHPTRALEDVPLDELSRWVMMTHSVRYAEGVLAGSGYKVTGARLEFGLGSMASPHPIRIYRDFYDARSETLTEFLARHGFDEGTPMIGSFDIVLDVEPF